MVATHGVPVFGLRSSIREQSGCKGQPPADFDSIPTWKMKNTDTVTNDHSRQRRTLPSSTTQSSFIKDADEIKATLGAVKRCYVCKQTKLSTEFWADRSRKDGKDTRCKSCRREQKRRLYAQRKAPAQSGGSAKLARSAATGSNSPLEKSSPSASVGSEGLVSVQVPVDLILSLGMKEFRKILAAKTAG